MDSMKFWMSLGALVLLVCPVLIAQTEAADEPAEPEEILVEEIIAKVNGRIVTRTELEQTLASYADELRRSGVAESDIPPRIEERRPVMLRDKIDSLLLLERADQLEVDVEDRVSKHVADLMLQNKIADPDEFARTVREQTGISYEDFREEIENYYLTQEVIGREVASQIVIPRTEVQAYYDTHHDEFMREERIFLREILISNEGATDEDAKKEADGLVERARRGELFDEMAREHSDAVTADEGGWLDPFKKGDLRTEIEADVWDKEKNYVTDPIKLDNGYLILKVIEHHQAGLAAFEEVENEITARLSEPKYQPLVRDYLTGLRRTAFLEIKDGWVDTSAAAGKDTSWTDPAELVPETVTRLEVLANPGRKKLLWLFPIPGTERAAISSSR